ncbi:MAG: hypothetical protein V4772_05505 [Pseudomonadota bacterium]
MCPLRGFKARRVEQEVRVLHVRLAGGQAGPLEVTCLIASEIKVPAGVKPVVWRLLTNRLVPTLQAALDLINWYCAHW